MMLWAVLTFLVVIFWVVVLLYGLISDDSLRSKILRLLAVSVLWSLSPRGSWFTFEAYIKDFGAAYSVWLIILLILLIPPYIYGFVSLLKENKPKPADQG